MREILVLALPGIAATLFGVLIVMLGAGNRKKKLIGGMRDFVGLLESGSRKSAFGEGIERFLTKNGVTFHYGKRMSAVKLVLVSVLLFAGGYVLGLQVSFSVGIPAGAFFAALPWMLVPVLNRKDNEKMLPDLQAVFRSLAMQIRAGVHVSDALAEMYVSITEVRLREAFIALGSDIILKSDMFSALENFQSKFDNRYVDSLCITVLQSMESGQASQLLQDIGDQMKDMEKDVLEKKKGKLDRSLTFYQLGMLSCILAVALYAGISYMLAAAVQIG
jgi:Flp pilus assembly protein TadB